MEILGTPKIMEKIQEIMITQISMIQSLEMLESCILGGFASYLNYDKKDMEQLVEKLDSVTNMEDAERFMVMANLVDEIFGPANTPEEQVIKSEFLFSIYLPSVKYYKSEILENEFLKRITFPNKEYGKYLIDNDKLIKGEVFMAGDPVGDGSIHISRLGYCDEDFEYPCIVKDLHNIHYFVNPKSINMYEPIIKSVTGKIIVFGLGIGYVPFMAAMKDTVDSITIVENDKMLIDIFKENVLPKCDNPDKIKIIKDDPTEWIERQEEFNYDYCIIQPSSDPALSLLDYLFVKHYERTWKNTKFFYYDEENILIDIQSFLMMNIIDCAFESPTLFDSEIGFETETLLELFKDELIATPDKLEYITNTKNIPDIILSKA